MAELTHLLNTPSKTTLWPLIVPLVTPQHPPLNAENVRSSQEYSTSKENLKLLKDLNKKPGGDNNSGRGEKDFWSKYIRSTKLNKDVDSSDNSEEPGTTTRSVAHPKMREMKRSKKKVSQKSHPRHRHDYDDDDDVDDDKDWSKGETDSKKSRTRRGASWNGMPPEQHVPETMTSGKTRGRNLFINNCGIRSIIFSLYVYLLFDTLAKIC